MEHKIFDNISKNNWDEVNKLIDENDDINIQDKNGNYLIEFIIINNKEKILKKILGKNPVIDFLNKDERSILYHPIIFSYIDIIKLILENDKKIIGSKIINKKDGKNLYPLHYSIRTKNKDIFDLLLKYNPDLYIYDNNGDSIIHLIVKNKNIDFLKKLKINYTEVKNNKNNENPLHIAASYDLDDFIEYFKNIYSLNVSENNAGLTPPMLCAINGNIKGLSIMLNTKKYDINLQDHRGNTLLHILIQENNIDMITDIIETYDFNFNLVNYGGDTCLHLILNRIFDGDDKNNFDLKTFITKTSLNTQNNEGNTAWHFLTKLDIFEEFTDILEEKKNNIYILNKENKTPFDLCSKKNTENLLDILSKSYYNLLKCKNATWVLDWEEECKNGNKNKKKCLELIRQKIKEGKSSIPSKIKNYCIEPEKIENINMTTFTGSSLDIITGLLYLTHIHKNILQVSVSDNFSHNKKVSDLYIKLGVTKNLDKDFLNFEIYWIYNILEIPTNLDEIIENFKKSDNKVLAIPLNIENTNGSHSNMIIIDKRFNSLERFEPNGQNSSKDFFYSQELLDNYLKKLLTFYFKDYEYFTPKQTQEFIGFQIYEVLETDKYKKIGDPNGFCSVWSLWYLDKRVSINLHPCKLAFKLMVNIKSQNASFKNLIRSFSVKILNLRSTILKQAQIDDINDYRNGNITDEDYNNIKNLIKNNILL